MLNLDRFVGPDDRDPWDEYCWWDEFDEGWEEYRGIEKEEEYGKKERDG